jgi:hypothetical protein
VALLKGLASPSKEIATARAYLALAAAVAFELALRDFLEGVEVGSLGFLAFQKLKGSVLGLEVLDNNEEEEEAAEDEAVVGVGPDAGVLDGVAVVAEEGASGPILRGETRPLRRPKVAGEGVEVWTRTRLGEEAFLDIPAFLAPAAVVLLPLASFLAASVANGLSLGVVELLPTVVEDVAAVVVVVVDEVVVEGALIVGVTAAVVESPAADLAAAAVDLPENLLNVVLAEEADAVEVVEAAVPLTFLVGEAVVADLPRAARRVLGAVVEGMALVSLALVSVGAVATGSHLRSLSLTVRWPLFLVSVLVDLAAAVAGAGAAVVDLTRVGEEEAVELAAAVAVEVVVGVGVGAAAAAL